MNRAILVAALLASGAASAQEVQRRAPELESSWAIKPLDVVLEGAFAAVLMLDYGQTRWIAQNPGRAYESNPIIGPHPSVGTVNVWLPLSLLGHAAVAAALPRPYRTVWQSVWIGVEVTAVGINKSLGAQLSF